MVTGRSLGIATNRFIMVSAAEVVVISGDLTVSDLTGIPL